MLLSFIVCLAACTQRGCAGCAQTMFGAAAGKQTTRVAVCPSTQQHLHSSPPTRLPPTLPPHPSLPPVSASCARTAR
jgi:hypothetical protein